jgi:hypothetical protein
MSRKKIKTKENFNPNDYVDPNTGETIGSKLLEKGSSLQLIKEKDTDFYIINSDEYIIIDSKALARVSLLLKQNELAKLLKMSDKVKTPFNIIYDNNTPYTAETLSELLEYDMNKFYAMVRKLVKIGVLAYVVCAPSGYLKKVYLLNPTFARKGKKYHDYTKDIFPDLGQ